MLSLAARARRDFLQRLDAIETTAAHDDHERSREGGIRRGSSETSCRQRYTDRVAYTEDMGCKQWGQDLIQDMDMPEDFAASLAWEDVLQEFQEFRAQARRAEALKASDALVQHEGSPAQSRSTPSGKRLGSEQRSKVQDGHDASSCQQADRSRRRGWKRHSSYDLEIIPEHECI